MQLASGLSSVQRSFMGVGPGSVGCRVTVSIPQIARCGRGAPVEEPHGPSVGSGGLEERLVYGIRVIAIDAVLALEFPVTGVAVAMPAR